MNEAPLLGVELTAELLNERLESYRVVREVGRGAMGIVFEAHQRGLERRVAVKVLPPNLSMRDRTVRRFLREAGAMGRLAHTNIVDVYQVGSHGSLHYFAMRFVDGPPLDLVLKAGVLGIGDVVQVGIDVASALAHAHSRGVLHRDVKPSNLLRDGERVVLTDFGLAKPMDSDDEDAMTESGDLVGTPLYMSPEQISGDSDGIDARSDVWGLGATLYELLIGRPPFSGGSAQAILNAILHRDPVLLRRQRADVPQDLEAVLLKCLEKDRNRRYSGAAGLHADLLAIQAGQSVSARPPRFFDPALRWSRRHPYQAAGIMIATLAFGGFVWKLQSSDQKRKDAVKEQQVAVSARKVAVSLQTLAIINMELLAATDQWSNAEGNNGLRLHALERVLNLQMVMPFDQYPEIAAQIMRVYARFSRELGNSEQAMTDFNRLYGEGTSRMVLAMRSAMLEGLEKLPEALAVHQQRASLYPKSPESWLDGARVLYMIALRENSSSGGDPIAAKRQFTRAVLLCDQALDRAVRALDANLAATVMIERARCLIALNQVDKAEIDLRQALENDPARADARGLLEACKPKLDSEELPTEVVTQVPVGTVQPDTAGAQPVASNAQKPATSPLKALADLPLIGRMNQSLDVDKQDLENAGKNLTSIYRGLRDVLRTAASGVPAAGAASDASKDAAPAGTNGNQ